MGLMQFLRRRAAPRPGQSGAAQSASMPGSPSAPMPGAQAAPEIYGPPREAIQETFTQQKGAMAYQAPDQITNEATEGANGAVHQAQTMAAEAGREAPKKIQPQTLQNAYPGPMQNVPPMAGPNARSKPPKKSGFMNMLRSMAERDAQSKAQRNAYPGSMQNAQPMADRNARPQAPQSASQGSMQNAQPMADRNTRPQAPMNASPGHMQSAPPMADRNAMPQAPKKRGGFMQFLRSLAERDAQSKAQRNANPGSMQSTPPMAARDAQPEAPQGSNPRFMQNAQPMADRNTRPEAPMSAYPGPMQSAPPMADRNTRPEAPTNAYPGFMQNAQTMAAREARVEMAQHAQVTATTQTEAARNARPEAAQAEAEHHTNAVVPQAEAVQDTQAVASQAEAAQDAQAAPTQLQTAQDAQAASLQPQALQTAQPQAQGPGTAQNRPLDPLSQILEGTGFDYDREQDIFYSVADPWQRRLGYCSLYDKWATLWGLVYDSEPVRFEYGGKRWMIEFWKGQYGITTGGEIGVYQSVGPDIHIPLVFRGPFYRSVSDRDALSMAFVLEKDSKPMFLRAHRRHWWLTGFILGSFTQPARLTMRAALVFRDYGLRDAFVAALYKMGYTDREVVSASNFVQVTLGKPHTKQPALRFGPICWLTMRRTRILVNMCNKVTGGLKDVDVMLLKLQTTSPHLYQLAMNMGMQKNLYKFLGSMGKYLGTN